MRFLRGQRNGELGTGGDDGGGAEPVRREDALGGRGDPPRDARLRSGDLLLPQVEREGDRDDPLPLDRWTGAARAGPDQPLRRRHRRRAARPRALLRHPPERQREGLLRHLPPARSSVPGRSPARARRRQHQPPHDADRGDGARCVVLLGRPQGQPVGAGTRAAGERGGARRHARPVRPRRRRALPRGLRAALRPAAGPHGGAARGRPGRGLLRPRRVGGDARGTARGGQPRVRQHR